MFDGNFSLVVFAWFAVGAVAAIGQTTQMTMRDPNTGNTFIVRQPTGDVPTEWIDPDTRHRVIRLTSEPGSASLYFHQNGYTPDGKKFVFTSPTGLYTFDMETRGIDHVLTDQVSVIAVARKTATVYYMLGAVGIGDLGNTSAPRAVNAVDLKTHQSRKIADIPAGFTIGTVNCDETLLGGTILYPPPGKDRIPIFERSANGRMDLQARFDLRLPMDLCTINIQTGELRKFNRCNDWLNHLQFSPVDPKLLMFCHEGPWHQVDRIWTINVDGGEPKLVHQRTMNMEIAGHEFWGQDGKTIWYDLQTPLSQVFWVAGYNIQTGERTQYHLKKSEWSVHFNVSPDGKLFCGDGGGPDSIAAGDNGQWIYLFRPKLLPHSPSPEGEHVIRSGVFEAERLVNLKDHDYALEPNVSFTPDMKWIVFRSNIQGPTHVYAVEVEKAK